MNSVAGPEVELHIVYTDTNLIGKGSFGTVHHARLVDTNEIVAIKSVLQDKRFKNRELKIMKMLSHPNVVKLKYYFLRQGEKVSIVHNLGYPFVGVG